MLYSNTEYNVVYVDPSAAAGGDGASPATALNDLPPIGGIADGTCYMIRRTARSSACSLPSGTNETVARVLLIGMPLPSDPLYALVPDEAKAAWGGDAQERANVRATSGSASMAMNQLETLLLHRINLFRSGVSSISAYLISSYQTADSKGVFTFDRCRFSLEGRDIDEDGYSGGAYTQNALCGYVRLGRVRMLNIRDCAVNLRPAEQYGGIYCQSPDILNFTGNSVNVLARGSMDYPPALIDLSSTRRGQIEAVVSGLSVRYLLNGGDGTCFDRVLSLSCFPSLRVKGVSATMADAAPGATRPSRVFMNGSLLNISDTGDYSVRDVSASLPYCRRFDSPFVRISGQTVNTYAGCEREIRDIVLSAGDENAIGDGRTYAECRNFSESQSLLSVQSYQYEGQSGYPKIPEIRDITLRNPRGLSLWASGCRVTEAVLEGGACLSGCLADITSISTWFPGYVLRLDNYTHARIGSITVNTANAEHPYDGDVVIQCQEGGHSGNVYVERCNVPLCPALLQTAAGDGHLARTCANAGEDGHYTMLSANTVADTWNVRREGGAGACLKIRCDACPTAGTMSLGRKPFRGLVLAPDAAGRRMLKLHVALKGFTDPDGLSSKFVVTATVDEGGTPRAYSSASDGRWADDTDAVWVNDSDLVQKVLEMPLDIPAGATVDVRLHYGWYSATGFVYVDPAATLEPLA